MEQFPTTESDVEKVIRIAKVLGIGIEEAADTCDAFHLALSDDRMRRAIFDVVDQLDRSAAKKGEPGGLIINYTVELGMEGIRVARYADEIPEGEMVELVPPHRANILLRIVDNFPTQEFLGPLIVNRPEPLTEEQCTFAQYDQASDVKEWRGGLNSDIELPSLDEEGCPVGRGGVTSSQREIPTELPSHWPKQAICLGPIRLKFAERFPCVSAAKLSSQPAASQAGNLAFESIALEPSHYLSSWAALPAGMPAFQSGLSPPHPSENLGHSDAKDVPPALGK